MAQRTLADKNGDVKTTFAIYRELLTPPIMREVVDNMTGAERQAAMQTAADQGDVQAYAALVQASLYLQRLVAENDRVALTAAVMVQSGVARQAEEN